MSFGIFQPVEETVTEDEKDFIEYMQVFAQTVCVHLQNTNNNEKKQYYRGMLFAIKSVSQVYDTLLKGDFQ